MQGILRNDYQKEDEKCKKDAKDLEHEGPVRRDRVKIFCELFVCPLNVLDR
eukprot:m.447885 g.447885  ORF g.447885 m.447885 type:complete len:51 (-) comp19573_c0_seq1:994-1146(-)